tara:strand:- start:1648 stop:2136 length:489 start_codon:yes stop_codon:yes gene_type:complete
MSEIDIIFYSVGGIGTIISVCVCYKICSHFRNVRRRSIDNISNQITNDITTDINSVSLRGRNCANSTCWTFPPNTIHPFSLTPDKYTENITKLPQTPPPLPVSDIEEIEVYTASNDVKEKYIKMLISDYICNNNYSITENDIRLKYNNFRTSKDISDFKMNI